MTDNLIIAAGIFSFSFTVFFIVLASKKQARSPAYGFIEYISLMCVLLVFTAAWIAGVFTGGSARAVFEIVKIICAALFPAFSIFFVLGSFKSGSGFKALKLVAFIGAAVYAALMSVNPSGIFYSVQAENAQGLNYTAYNFSTAGYALFSILIILILMNTVLLVIKGIVPKAAFLFRPLSAAAMLLPAASEAMKITGVTQPGFTAAISAIPALLFTLAFIKYARTDSAAHTRKNIFNMLSDAFIVLDTDYNVVLVNTAAERIFGIKQETAERKSLSSIAEGIPDYAKCGLEYTEMQLKQGGVPQFYEFRKMPLTGKTALSGWLLMIKNITREKALQRRLNYLAECDPVTGLMNRGALMRTIIDHADISGLKGTRFIAVSISNINALRETAAPAQEQDIFRLVAEYLKTFMLPESFLACFGGHEFFMFDKKNLLTPAIIRAKAKKAAPLIYNTQAGECRIELKAGLFIAGDNIRPEDGISQASFALKMALGSDDFLYCYDNNAEMRHKLLNGLTTCLENPGEWFHLEYQPVIDVKTNIIIGAEALLRWRHPEFGSISPALFIPLAEDSGAIMPLGRFVVETACKYLSSWKDIPEKFKMAVNISKKQIDSPGFVSTLLEIVNDCGIAPGHLEFEITETAASSDSDNMLAFCKSIKNAGIRISLDDFGSGNTALAYISDWQCDTLKIDAAMSADAMNNERKTQILSSIVTMCESMNVDLIIEHIDSMKAVAFFRDIGFRQVQGYVFARPMPGTQLKTFYKEFTSSKTVFLAPRNDPAA